MDVTERISKLRELMYKRGLAAYIVPSTDPHQSEYVPERWRRREFISGFDGSAGTVVITADKAGLWTDSRYFLQAEKQLQGTGITLFRVGEPDTPDMAEWLCSELRPGDRIGLDPSVHSVNEYEKLRSTVEAKGISLHPVLEDLVDVVWDRDLPPVPDKPIRLHPDEYAGETASSKLARLKEAMNEAGVGAALLCALDEIAWLFNLRGEDIDYNPVFLAFAVVTRDKTILFVNEQKLTGSVMSALDELAEVREYRALDDFLLELAKNKNKVWIDPATTSQRLLDLLQQGAEPVRMPSPIARWKSIKNDTEIRGMMDCHKRDGAAVVKFLAWLSKAVAKGGVTELGVADKLHELRSQDPKYVGPSFETIAGYREHGAIVHYAATKESDYVLEPSGLLLVDSGGQYHDGTTDITRTVALGLPTGEEKRAYTAVLKAHLALARAKFPMGTDGYQLDTIARSVMWGHEMNYGHGTGHGVGAHLCVHEGPFSISLRKNFTPLEPGQVTSNEPGLYKTGEFGVRIENLMLVRKSAENEFGGFLELDHLTMCPYDLNLIDVSMMEPREIEQVNEYHETVRRSLESLLDDESAEWLATATSPIPF